MNSEFPVLKKTIQTSKIVRYNQDQFPYSVLGQSQIQKVKQEKEQVPFNNYYKNTLDRSLCYKPIQEEELVFLNDNSLMIEQQLNSSELQKSEIDLQLFKQISNYSKPNQQTKLDDKDSQFMIELKDYRKELAQNENYYIDKIITIPKHYYRQHFPQTKTNNQSFLVQEQQNRSSDMIRANINLLRFDQNNYQKSQPKQNVIQQEQEYINPTMIDNVIAIFRKPNKIQLLLEKSEIFDNVNKKTFYICKKYYDFNFKSFQQDNWKKIQQFLEPTLVLNDNIKLLGFQQIQHIKLNFDGIPTIIFSNINFQYKYKEIDTCLVISIRNIEQLVINNCTLQKISISHQVSIQKLFIYNNTDNINSKPLKFHNPDSLFNNMKNLKYLHLIYCDLHQFSIIDCQNLLYLSLQNCFRVPALNSFNISSSIQELNLQYANIRISPNLSHLTNLLYLNLNSTRIKQVDFKILPKSLKYLYCQNLRIVNLNGVQNLDNLEILDLLNNNITEIFLLPSNVQILNLQSNPISTLNGIEKLQTIQTLIITNNEQLDTDFWFISSALNKLIAINCSIVVIPDMRNLENLLYLDLSDNVNIDILGICLSLNIETLLLNNCGLQYIPSLQHLIHLKELHLDSNEKIQFLTENLPMNIEILSLRFCKLQHIYISRFNDLKKVYIEGNLLKQLYFCQFSQLTIIGQGERLQTIGINEDENSKLILYKFLKIYDQYCQCNEYRAKIQLLKLKLSKQ